MCCRCGTKQPDTSNSCSTNRSLQIFAVKSTTAGHVQLAGKHTTCMLPNRSRPYCVHPTLSSSKCSSFHTLVLTRVNIESPVADRLNIHSEPTIGTRFSARNTHKPSFHRQLFAGMSCSIPGRLPQLLVCIQRSVCAWLAAYLRPVRFCGGLF